jgi:hypothetical protein
MHAARHGIDRALSEFENGLGRLQPIDVDPRRDGAHIPRSTISQGQAPRAAMLGIVVLETRQPPLAAPQPGSLEEKRR